MAYVDSYYLEDRVDANVQRIGDDEVDSSEPAIIIGQPNEVASDYCGFVSEEIPPIYREQLREAVKSQMMQRPLKLTTSNATIVKNPNQQDLNASIMDNKRYFAKPAEYSKKSTKKEIVESGGSAYAWEETKPIEAISPITITTTNLYTNDYYTTDCLTVHDYIPGFSPPTQNDNVQYRTEFKLPKAMVAEATANIFHVAPTSNRLSTLSMTGVESSQSNDVSSLSTARLGPAYGCLSTSGNQSFVGKDHDYAAKYAGIGAFKPVNTTVDSHYVAATLN
ncbi:unnamed protein product [Caenorhabditis bovis]|uniref:Uncharacterized protein n=1 Tax=Caenorhabditis bovis TaxID=2654633 RepID=A0A8S1ET89_9PELO|nr:unnamed protein product [Caenorhabditis bovis]